MIKLLDILENKILVPRRSSEEREKKYAIIVKKQIQQYIENGSQGDLDLSGGIITSLPDNLITVGGTLNLRQTNIQSLNNLQSVGGSLFLDSCLNFKSFGNLISIGKNLSVHSVPLKSFDNIKYIGGKVTNYAGSIAPLGPEFESLGNLEYVGELSLRNTSVKSLGNLTKAKDLLLTGTQIEDLGNLKDVNYLYLGHTPISKKYTEEQIRQMVNIKKNLSL
jgi:hypothetical protein